jgi:hypothetical protein
LTIEKYFKRMKLWFSTTVEDPVIDNSVLKMLPDFNAITACQIEEAGSKRCAIDEGRSTTCEIDIAGSKPKEIQEVGCKVCEIDGAG